MIRSLACIVLVTGLATSVAFAADPPATASAPAGTVANTDTFLKQAAVGNQFEIDSSKLALSKSNSADVKAFATQMVNDHGAAGMAFKKAVSDAKLKQPSTSDDKHDALLKDLPPRAARTSTRPMSTPRSRATSKPSRCSRPTPRMATIRA